VTGSIKVLLPHLPSLVSWHELTQPTQRFEALERVLCHGKPRQLKFELFDELRLSLFGIDPGKSLPIAALTRVHDGPFSSVEEGYFIRVDPVTLITDLSRVVMTQQGFGDLQADEQKDIIAVVRTALADEGFILAVDHQERWTIKLDHALAFEFTHIDNALGMDIAEVLPDHPAALAWRKVFNEIQMALHACDVNKQRRQKGQMEINSVWFWGGGTFPLMAQDSLPQQVFSNHPVSAGLAQLQTGQCFGQQTVLEETVDLSDKDILVDWTSGHEHPKVELGQLNTLMELLIENAKVKKMSIELYDRCNQVWIYRPGNFFHRFISTKPLALYMNKSTVS
jgi:hypothetical protein